MKAHMKHHRKHKAEGGKTEEFDRDNARGEKTWEKDDKLKPMSYTYRSKVEDEAEERKHGGRMKRRHGGHVHHEKPEHLKHAKHLGHIDGERNVAHGRKPRKSGGRAGSNFDPLSSANKKTAAGSHHPDANPD